VDIPVVLCFGNPSFSRFATQTRAEDMVSQVHRYRLPSPPCKAHVAVTQKTCTLRPLMCAAISGGQGHVCDLTASQLSGTLTAQTISRFLIKARCINSFLFGIGNPRFSSHVTLHPCYRYIDIRSSISLLLMLA